MTSTHMPNFIELEENFVDVYVPTDERTFETGFIMSTLSNSRPKNQFDVKPTAKTSSIVNAVD